MRKQEQTTETLIPIDPEDAWTEEGTAQEQGASEALDVLLEEYSDILTEREMLDDKQSDNKDRKKEIEGKIRSHFQRHHITNISIKGRTIFLSRVNTVKIEVDQDEAVELLMDSDFENLISISIDGKPSSIARLLEKNPEAGNIKMTVNSRSLASLLGKINDPNAGLTMPEDWEGKFVYNPIFQIKSRKG